MSENSAIPAVEIFSAGTHRDKEYTPEDLAEIVRNFWRYSSPSCPQVYLHVPAVIGHEEDQQYLERTDIPAAGWVTDVWRDGSSLFANFDHVPEEVARLIRGKTYRMVSAEIYDEPPEGMPSGAVGKMLRRVAFLGADIPQVKGLAEIPTPVPSSYSEGKSRGRSRSFAPEKGGRLTYRRRVSIGEGCWAAFSEVVVRKMGSRRPRPNDMVHVDRSGEPSRRVRVTGTQEYNATGNDGRPIVSADVVGGDYFLTSASDDRHHMRNLKRDDGSQYGDPEDYSEDGEPMNDLAGGTPAPDHDDMRQKMLKALEEMGIDVSSAGEVDDRFLAEIVRHLDAQQEQEQEQDMPAGDMGAQGMPEGMEPVEGGMGGGGMDGGGLREDEEEEHFAEDDGDDEDDGQRPPRSSEEWSDWLEGSMEQSASRKDMRRGYQDNMGEEDEESDEDGPDWEPADDAERDDQDIHRRLSSADRKQAWRDGERRYGVVRTDSRGRPFAEEDEIIDPEDMSRAEGDDEPQADMDRSQRDRDHRGKKPRHPKKDERGYACDMDDCDEDDGAWESGGEPVDEDERYAEGDEEEGDDRRTGRRRWREWDYAENDDDGPIDLANLPPLKEGRVTPDEEWKRRKQGPQKPAGENRPLTDAERRRQTGRYTDDPAEDYAEDDQDYDQTTHNRKHHKKDKAMRLATGGLVKGGVMKMSEILHMVEQRAAAIAAAAVRREAKGAAGQLRRYSEKIGQAEKKRGVDAVLERLSREGKLLPAEEQAVRGRLMRADCTTAVAKFSEKGKTRLLTEFDLQVRELDARPTLFRERFSQPATQQGSEDAEVQKVEAHYEAFSERFKRIGTSKDEMVSAFKAKRKHAPETTAEQFLGGKL